ncbi:pirin family protein [Gilvimarinus xylanilyticus]|uniref:Pirin family protein n=1 Tax=Gilvimarinus xylanilyticus TaxID=2944139 RepID=A0A9X2KW68_9GAMM|nr:pirin family protein [Gilvimarinus xylanilyticus]MCP8898680.1 pirin family protein [Gilvimarinus xylanilyticus]
MSRQLRQVIPAVATSDGAGVKIKRSLGQSQVARLDPILMLDEFNSDDAADYLAGFPSHPHRGFETVTYMLDGHMLHEDHMGNKGDLRAGDVQWMTAGRGIIHSEMPQQLEGRMRGFQLWLNLPAAEKMKPANYRDIPAAQIPTVALDNDVSIKVIVGPLTHNGETTDGAISGVSTQPIYWDVSLPANTSTTLSVPEHHQLFVYSYEGEIALGDDQRPLDTSQAGILTSGDTLTLKSKAQPARVLVIGGKAIGEPIAQYGPFVMNTSEEIEQAINDYRSGQLAG